MFTFIIAWKAPILPHGFVVNMDQLLPELYQVSMVPYLLMLEFLCFLNSSSALHYINLYLRVV